MPTAVRERMLGGITGHFSVRSKNTCFFFPRDRFVRGRCWVFGLLGDVSCFLTMKVMAKVIFPIRDERPANEQHSLECSRLLLVI